MKAPRKIWQFLGGIFDQKATSVWYISNKNSIYVVLQPYILLDVFHYFGHHGRPASQILNMCLSLDYFNPAIILIKKIVLLAF